MEQKPEANPFEMTESEPSDTLGSPAEGTTSTVGSLRYAWIVYWIVVWAGTTAAGSLFGLLLTVLSESLAGFVFGALWSGIVGLLVMSHLAAFCWMFRMLKLPYLLAALSGGLVGAICGLIVLSIITAPLGAGGAFIGTHWYLNSKLGKYILDEELRAQTAQSTGRWNYNLADLFWRMTVVAVFVAGWSLFIRSMYF